MNTILLNYPVNNQTICLCPAQVVKYLNSMKTTVSKEDCFFNSVSGYGVDVEQFYDPKTNLQQSVPITFRWQSISEKYSEKFILQISKTSTFESSTDFRVESCSLAVYNLKTGTTYHWRVRTVDGRWRSGVNSFKTTVTPRLITAGTVRNIRDIGGYYTEKGSRIKQGLIYRGGELVADGYSCYDEGRQQYHPKSLDHAGLNILKNDLGVKTELDFRRPEESNQIVESALGPEVRYIRVPISPYGDVFGYDKSGKELPKMRELYRQVFEILCDAENYPIYFHCWGGADRTGTVAFLLNGLLGVSYTDLLADFELTSFSQNLRTARYFDEQYSSFSDLIFKLEKYAEKGEKIYETIERYLKNIGVSTEAINNLKANMIE